MSLAREVNAGELCNVPIDVDDVSISLPGIGEESTNMHIDLNEISLPHAGECSTQVDLNEVVDLSIAGECSTQVDLNELAGPGQLPSLGWMK
ncbi:hypothetical protein LINPERPRIM_LOCUS20203 [Linum perenne]